MAIALCRGVDASESFDGVDATVPDEYGDAPSALEIGRAFLSTLSRPGSSSGSRLTLNLSGASTRSRGGASVGVPRCIFIGAAPAVGIGCAFGASSKFGAA